MSIDVDGGAADAPAAAPPSLQAMDFPRLVRNDSMDSCSSPASETGNDAGTRRRRKRPPPGLPPAVQLTAPGILDASAERGDSPLRLQLAMSRPYYFEQQTPPLVQYPLQAQRRIQLIEKAAAKAKQAGEVAAAESAMRV